jgi:hypothetical protein
MIAGNRGRRIAPGALAGLVLAAAWTAQGETAASQPNTNAPARRLDGVARITFQGTSTLHNFEGHVMSEPFPLILTPNSWSAKAQVLGGDMTTSNIKRDKNMWVMLATNLHPRLSGEVQDSPRPPGPGTNATLALTIRNQKMDLPVRITDWSETKDGIHFHADWELSLKAYGLKAPSVAGFIKVGDIVRLHADIAATNPPTATKSTE